MTETDVPLLGPGRELTQAGTQALMAIASALRESRYAQQRRGWSGDRDAARTAEAHRRAAEPPVRLMSEAEFRLFEQGAASGRDGFDSRDAHSVDGDVSVTVGPMPDGRGWGLVATAQPAGADTAATGTGTDPGSGPARVSSAVVVVDEVAVKRLADELLGRGPEHVARLGQVAEYATRRAEHARTEVRESREHLLARTADAVRQTWSDEPGLAARIVEPGTGGDVQDGYNGALGALAQELSKLEDRGFAMTDVLERIRGLTSPLRRATNPAAMASSFVKRLSPDLGVVNLDGAGARGAGGGSTDGQPTSAAVVRPAGASSARPSTGTSSTDTPSTPDPADGAAAGRDGEPARPLRQTLPDQQQARDLVERWLPAEASEAVLSSAAWPGLARRLLAWRDEGLPMSRMLASLPATKIVTATEPAGWTTILLNAKAVHYRAERLPTRPGEQAGSHSADAGPGSRSAIPLGPATPRRADTSAHDPQATEPPAHPPVETGTAGTDDRAAASQRDQPPGDQPQQPDGTPGALPGPSGPPQPPVPITSLDPTSEVDRIALRAAHGSGDPARDEVIERILRAGADRARADATVERARAENAERVGAHDAATPDDPRTPAREDVAGQDQAHIARQQASTDRAAADTDSAAAAAQADRAYRTSTAGSDSPAPSGPPAASGGAPSPHPRVTPPPAGPAARPTPSTTPSPRPRR